MADNKQTKRSAPIKLQWGAALYFVLYVYALLMTQLLRNSVSAVFFWFMVIAAPLSFFIMLLGRAAIQIYVMTDKNQTEKLSPVEYEIRVINASPLPYPYIEVIMSKPRMDGVRCLHQRLMLSLIPFGGYSVKNTVYFRYRGLYEIGVHEIYICDPLRIFKMRVDIDNFSNVTVYPRKLELELEASSAVSDIPSPFVRTFDSRDKSEISNIREYRMGDTMKSIHWKLSSKSEELQVKDYNTNDDRHTYIFVDLAKPTPPPEVKRDNAKKELRELEKEQSDGIFSSLSLSKENKSAHKYRRRRRRANTAKDIETIEMIDALISETSGRGAGRKKDELDKIFEDENKLSADEMIAKLSGIIGNDTEDATEDDLILAKKAWGGIVRDEFEDEIPDFCADGVIEIAVAEMSRELKRANRCTVVWYDKRSDSGYYAVDMRDFGTFDDTYLKFSSAAVVSEENQICDLCGIISESVNVTIKIVTPNVDPASVARYCAVPTVFGGAGTGCHTEVLFFNPTDKYVSPAERIDYCEGVRLELRRNGIALSEIIETQQSDGRAVLTATDLI